VRIVLVLGVSDVAKSGPFEDEPKNPIVGSGCKVVSASVSAL
jgi:hypothetical protein